jgi:hypothetical protein
MKHLIIFTLLYTISQFGYSQSRDDMIGSALEEYGKVAGAWFLNERCSYIENDDQQTFEDNVALITTALGQDLGNPKMLFMIQASAKKAANDPKYSDCNGTTKELFEYGHNHSTNWSEQIRKIQSKQKKG